MIFTSNGERPTQETERRQFLRRSDIIRAIVNPWREDLQVLNAILTDRYPIERPRRHSPIEKILCTLTVLIGLGSLSKIKKLLPAGIGKSHAFMDFYVIAWAGTMSLLLFWAASPTWVVAVVAFYRVVDIVNYRVFFILVKSQERPWTEDVLRRSLVIAVVNFYEVVVGFAIMYLFCGCIKQAAVSALDGPVSAFYFSLVTMATVGYGDFTPATSAGRILSVFQITTTIIFVLFLLPALLSVFSSSLTRDRT